MTRLTQLLIGLFIVVVVGAIVVRLMGNGGGTDDEEAAVAGEPPVPSGSILVTLASSSTKAGWLDQVIEKFNAEGNRAASGDTIVVEASHVRSGSSMNDILDGKLKPIAWSPCDQS